MHTAIIALVAWSQLEILSEPDANPFECTSSDVEKAYSTLDLYSLYVSL